MKFTLIIYAMRAVTAIGRAATWLLNRWTRRQVTKRAKLRMERARGYDEQANAALAHGLESGKTRKYFKSDEQAKRFLDWVNTPDLSEMSAEEFEYKENL